MVFFMATIFGDVQYSQVMGHLPTPEKTLEKPAVIGPFMTVITGDFYGITNIL